MENNWLTVRNHKWLSLILLLHHKSTSRSDHNSTFVFHYINGIFKVCVFWTLVFLFVKQANKNICILQMQPIQGLSNVISLWYRLILEYENNTKWFWQERQVRPNAECAEMILPFRVRIYYSLGILFICGYLQHLLLSSWKHKYTHALTHKQAYTLHIHSRAPVSSSKPVGQTQPTTSFYVAHESLKGTWLS